MSNHSIRVERIKKDHRVALIVTCIIFLNLALTLYFSVTFIPMPPLPETVLFDKAEMEMAPEEKFMPLEIALGGGGGGGEPIETENITTEIVPQQEQFLNEESGKESSSSGGSKTTNSKKPSNRPTSTTTKKPNNDFSFNPNGGKGGGKDGKNGSGIGPDSGDGKGPGGPGKGSGGSSGGAVKRFYINTPNTSGIHNDEFCTITFRVIVDENGELVGNPTLVGGTATTTSNSGLIEQVKQLVKRELRYNAVKGAERFTDKVMIQIKAN
jgi:hypothetical protein